MKTRQHDLRSPHLTTVQLGAGLTALLLVASWMPLSQPAAARDGGEQIERSSRRSGGGPFDYVDEADRQRENQGRPLPGQQVVGIESRDGRRLYQRVKTCGYVRRYRQFSSGPGRQGRDWGYDQRGIWVSNGLRAE